MVQYYKKDTLDILVMILYVVLGCLTLIIPLLNALHVPKSQPMKQVSLLIPARNEQDNLQKNLESWCSQGVPVHIMDDQSTDNSAHIIKQYAKKYGNLHYHQSTSIPKGWLGKSWACYQLAKKVDTNYIFIDADVFLAPGAINYLSQYSNFTCFPTQKTNWQTTWIVPLLSWSFLSLVPIPLMHLHPSLQVANGQCLGITHKTYWKIDGHAAVKNRIAEDIAIAKHIPLQVLFGKNKVSCTMYKSFKEAVQGFQKNLYPASGLPKIPFMIIMIGIMLISLVFLPFGLLQRLIMLTQTRATFKDVITFPVQLLILPVMAWISLGDKRKWKNRNIQNT